MITFFGPSVLFHLFTSFVHGPVGPLRARPWLGLLQPLYASVLIGSHGGPLGLQVLVSIWTHYEIILKSYEYSYFFCISFT